MKHMLVIGHGDSSAYDIMPNCPYNLTKMEYQAIHDCAGCVNGSGCKLLTLGEPELRFGEEDDADDQTDTP